jgi:hypothetical protein
MARFLNDFNMLDFFSTILYSGCKKNVPLFEGFFLQPLKPALRISEFIFEKRNNRQQHY